MCGTNVRVDFRIMGDEFDVQAISNELGIFPTITWKTDDLIRNTGRKRTYTAWIFSTGVEETLDINTQIKKITNTFFPKEQLLQELKKHYNLDFCIDIVIIIENQSPPAIYLDESIIHFASKLDAKFDIDTYVN